MNSAENPVNESLFTPEIVFNRTRRLLGDTTMERLARCRVIIFGIGGVGSWTAEALARSGVGHITVVDADKVSPTNINRQSEARRDTIGVKKVEALASQLRQVAPGIEITEHCVEYDETTAPQFDLEQYDYVVDAIDSLSAKMLLIRKATEARHPVFFSSMGAALKVDPTAIRTAEFWKVEGCPLAASLRRRFRKTGVFPRRKFTCVYSPELLPNLGEVWEDDYAATYNKVAANGSLCHITAIFGMTIAGLIIRHITSSNKC